MIDAGTGFQLGGAECAHMVSLVSRSWDLLRRVLISVSVMLCRGLEARVSHSKRRLTIPEAAICNCSGTVLNIGADSGHVLGVGTIG